MGHFDLAWGPHDFNLSETLVVLLPHLLSEIFTTILVIFLRFSLLRGKLSQLSPDLIIFSPF